MTYLITMLGQFQNRYKMVLILTFGLILLLLASAGKIHAEVQNKAQAQYMTGLKLLADKSDAAAASHAKANIWFTMAASDGHGGALFHLGVSYETGRGVQKNLELAAHFYRLAAARYHVAAQYNLAVMHANGMGMERDLEKALALLLIATQKAGLDPKARHRLDEFQSAIRAMLNNAQIRRTEWQVERLFGMHL